MNEELQSANEELETSKEEVQSVNEELASVNSELHEKIAELTRTNNDITNLLASTRVATLFLDTQLRIARYTPDVTAIYRLNPSDIGRPIADLTSSLAYPELVSDAAVVLERLGTIERHVRNEHGGHYLVRLMPYRTLDLRVEGVVATFVDVSNLERAREELSVALGLVEDYKEALDASTQVLILGAEGEAVDANERFLELVGRPKVDVIGRLRLLDPRWEPAQGVARAWEALRRGEVWRGVLPLATARDELTVEATIVPVAPGKDGSRRYLAIVLDITERVRAAEALRESEVRFRALFEQAATGIALVDREERVVTSNQALGVMLGYAPAELAGTPLTRYAHPEDRALDHELRREVLAAARAQYEIEKRYIARDGSSIIVRESVSSIRHAPGGAQHLVVIMQDVTQVRRAEEALRSQTSLAYLGEMSAVVAHEVRNALSGIRAAVDVVGGGLPEGSMERRAVEEVRARIGSLNDTVEDLLRFSRPRRPQIAEVSIRRVLEEVARSLSATGQRASLDVQGEDVVLEGDDQLLGSAFLNLCLNAAQALDGDGTIVVSTRAEQRSVIVDIVDHGSGIPPHLREEIFEPFFTTRSRGTGLGLPIARRVVEAHGGTIEIGDVEGGGTRVTVRLPIAQGLSASK